MSAQPVRTHVVIPFQPPRPSCAADVAFGVLQ